MNEIQKNAKRKLRNKWAALAMTSLTNEASTRIDSFCEGFESTKREREHRIKWLAELSFDIADGLITEMDKRDEKNSQMEK